MKKHSLEVGWKIKDNDPRIGVRHLFIESFHTNVEGKSFAVCRGLGARSSVHINTARIYTDDKERRSGFTVVRR